MVTLDDIAKEVGVSKVTVSNALRGKANVSKEMTARITQVARSMHYRIGARSVAARNLKTQNEQTQGPVSIIAPSNPDIWTAEFVQHCVNACTQAQRQVFVQYVDAQAEFELEQLANQVADGMIIAHPTLPDATLQQLVLHRPTVCIDRLAGGRDADAVLTDSDRGMQNGIEYLVSSGKRKILIIDQPDLQEHQNQQNFPDLQKPQDPQTQSTEQHRQVNEQEQAQSMRFSALLHERKLSALHTLEELGIPTDASSVITVEQTRDAVAHAVSELGNAIMQYDALACLNDDTALGALQALHRAQLRIPQDVAVLGFGGTQLGKYCYPELTSVNTHIEKVAQTAVLLLINRLTDEDNWMPTTITVPSSINLKQSA